jgi:STE24 endopeptidase
MNEDKATRYHRRRRRADVMAAAVAALTLAVLLLSGATLWLSEMVAAIVDGAGVVRFVIATVVFVLLVGAPILAARFPFDVFREWTLDRVYELERVSFAAWLSGYARGVIVLALLTCLAMLAIRTATLVGALWWLGAALVLWAGHLAWTVAAPIVLLVFGGLRPLVRPHIVERLGALGRRARASLDVYEWRGGDDSRRAHAALGGVGRTRRVILSDTLLESLTVDEIEVVVAHELAHHVHGDVWLSSLWRLLVLVAGTGAAAATLRVWPADAPMDPRSLAALPVIGAVVWLVSTMLSPIGYAISRAQERRADAFAIEMTGNPAAFLTSMRRLAASNLVEERPSRLTRLLSSHPSIHDRMSAAAASRGAPPHPSTSSR